MTGLPYLTKYDDLLIRLSLAVLILITYWQVQYFDFIDYDDVSYIIQNYHVKSGLTWDGFVWAMTDIHTGYWHPLTWISHMLDYQLFRTNAGGHHWTNVILHIFNAMLLYILLKRTTGETWKSTFVAAVFAVHPLNVESVAWVAERKNVLSTFFWFMATYSYVCYVERPSFYKYVLVLLAFSLGLMAKPMLLTFPFVLLLMDYWPLNRFKSWRDLYPLIIEKVPLFILTLIICIFTFIAAKRMGAITSSDTLGIGVRMSNSLVSYSQYLGKIFWPENLSVFYPYVRDINLFQITAAIIILIFISFFALYLRHTHPYISIGWLWYLGTLIPVIGFIQAGEQAMADRYIYISGIGIFIMVAWGIPDLLKKWSQRNVISIALAASILISLVVFTRIQVKYWKNSVTLFEHALLVTNSNHLAHNNLGVFLLNSGKSDEAVKHFAKALEIKPDYSEAHNNMGLFLASQGRLPEALFHYTEALKLKRDNEKAHNNLGIVLANMNRPDKAMEHFRDALKINPENAAAYNNIGSVLAMQGKVSEAIGYFEMALKYDAENAMAHNNLGLALVYVGRFDEANDHFAEALKINPHYLEAPNNIRSNLR